MQFYITEEQLKQLYQLAENLNRLDVFKACEQIKEQRCTSDCSGETDE